MLVDAPAHQRRAAQGRAAVAAGGAVEAASSHSTSLHGYPPRQNHGNPCWRFYKVFFGGTGGFFILGEAGVFLSARVRHGRSGATSCASGDPFE